MKRWADGDHQLQALGHGGKRGSSRPGVERRRFNALDIVQVKLGDQCQVVTELLGTAGQPARIDPARFHLFIVQIAKPAAEDGKPKAVAHPLTPSTRRSSPAALRATCR